MTKINPIERLTSYLLIILPYAYALTIYNKLPQILAVHFSPANTVNGQLSKGIFLMASLLLGLFVQGLIDWTLSQPDRITNVSFAHAIRWLLPLIWSLATLAILWRNLSDSFPIIAFSLYAVGVTLLVISNYLPKQVQAGRKPLPRGLAYSLMVVSLAILGWATFLL